MSKRTFSELVELMARLRAPDGCPWDRAQDSRSLRTHLIEEAYEVVDAIDAADDAALQEELGDLLLQVLFHAQIAREADRFTIDDVLAHLHDKLVRRHPHVFGDTRVERPEQALARWEALKAAERESNGEAAGNGSLLDRIPRALPAQLEAFEMTRRAARVGFDWQRLDDVLRKLNEEVSELREAAAVGKKEAIEDEVGDLLFVAVNIARKAGQDPEVALRRANRKFSERFRAVEEELTRRGRRLEDSTLEEMDALWEEAKQREAGR